MVYADPFIENALSCGNYKLALQLVDRKIKEHPNSSYYFALRAQILAYQSPKFRQQAIKEASDLLARCPTDIQTLTILSEVFDLCNYVPPVDVFEAVSKKHPTSALVYEWFSHSVETGNLIQVQKSTMMLTKVLANNNSSGDQFSPSSARMAQLYASIGFLLACNCCGSRITVASRKLFPLLGLKLVEKAKPQNAQELFVYCELLMLAGRDEQCIEVLKEILAKENDLQLKIMYFALLDKAGKYLQLYEACRHYLVDLKEDDWNTWKLFIKASGEIDRTADCLKIIEEYSDGRNKGLSYLELSKINPEVSAEKYFEAYILKYGSKKCCFQDLVKFLDEHPKLSNTNDILDRIYEKEIAPVLSKPKEKDLVLIVNYMKFKLHEKNERLNEPDIIKQCCEFYIKTEPLLDSLQQFDFSASSEFVITACEALLSQFKGEPNDLPTLLIRIVVIMESALVKNPYEFHLNLWLIALYSKLNLVSRAETLFESLKVKFVQLDTLSTILSTRISSLETKPNSSKSNILSQTSKFYLDNVQREVPQLILNGFKQGSFSKLQGIFEFENRINFSFTRLQNTNEQIRNCRLQDNTRKIELTLKKELRNLYKVYRLQGNELDQRINDNRDKKTFWDCGMHQRVENVSNKLDMLNPVVNMDYLAITSLLNLLIYDFNSSLYENYIKEYLELYNKLDNIPLTEAEKWNLSVIAHIFEPSQIRAEPKIPKNQLNFNFNHTIFIITDCVKQLRYMISDHSENMTHKQISSIRSLKKQYTDVLKKVKKDVNSYKKNEKKQITNAEAEVKRWFAKNELGKMFSIDTKTITSVFEEIGRSGQQAMKQLNTI